MIKLVGRTKEQAILEEAMQSPEPEMVALFGRRRVGKTFLVRSFFADKIDLEITGIQNSTSKPQIENFHYSVNELSASKNQLPLPKNWLAAFRQLITVLNGLPKIKRKRVLFFDELPWLASKKSGFLSAFGFFWNNYASKHDILVIICGSAASWMIQKIVHNKGGLHNRITQRIHLKPFNLTETEAYFAAKKINLTRYQIVQIYMITGGIPYYLKEIKRGKSWVQNIDDMCFAEGGLLRKEFLDLYPALFENAEKHIDIIRVLGSKRKGLTRKEILRALNSPSTGVISKLLKELIHSGFVSAYYPFGKKKKSMLYRLTDEYSLFYLQFIEGKRTPEGGMWQTLSQTQSYKSWSGYAFENVCLKHNLQIKEALRIGGIYSETSAFFFAGNDTLPGTQIDMLIDRNDNVINICEIKFYNDKFILTKEYAEKLRLKRTIFTEATQTKKQIFVTLISTFGIMPNAHSSDIIDVSLDLNALFN